MSNPATYCSFVCPKSAYNITFSELDAYDISESDDAGKRVYSLVPKPQGGDSAHGAGGGFASSHSAFKKPSPQSTVTVGGVVFAKFSEASSASSGGGGSESHDGALSASPAAKAAVCGGAGSTAALEAAAPLEAKKLSKLAKLVMIAANQNHSFDTPYLIDNPDFQLFARTIEGAQKASSKLMKAMQNLQKLTQGWPQMVEGSTSLEEMYWFEKIFPLHPYGSDMDELMGNWRMNKVNGKKFVGSFCDWLTLKGFLPSAPGVKYLDEESRKRFEVRIENGIVFIKLPLKPAAAACGGAGAARHESVSLDDEEFSELEVAHSFASAAAKAALKGGGGAGARLQKGSAAGDEDSFATEAEGALGSAAESAASEEVSFVPEAEGASGSKVEKMAPIMIEGAKYIEEPLNTARIGGKPIYVLSQDGKLYVGPYRTGKFHHSSFLQGGPVLGAGEIHTTPEGKITIISSKSGHYKPSAEQMFNVCGYLMANGIKLKDVKLMENNPDGSITNHDCAERYHTESPYHLGASPSPRKPMGSPTGFSK